MTVKVLSPTSSVVPDMILWMNLLKFLEANRQRNMQEFLLQRQLSKVGNRNILFSVNNGSVSSNREDLQMYPSLHNYYLYFDFLKLHLPIFHVGQSYVVQLHHELHQTIIICISNIETIDLSTFLKISCCVKHPVM